MKRHLIRFFGRRTWTLLCAGMAAALIWGCSGDGKDSFPAVEKTSSIAIHPVEDLNLILINIDSLRADHLGCYGNTDVDTSNIDGLADRGIKFEYACTGTPQTLPGYASLMTGNTPLKHGVRGDEHFYLSDEQETLAEHLKQQGFSTAAFVSRFGLNHLYGLGQGFDLYNDDLGMPRGADILDQLQQKQEAEKVVTKALNWLRRHKEGRFFMWLHFSDLISPTPPPAYMEQYSTNPYDGALAYLDSALGNFMQKLNDLGLYRKSLIVLTSDHGMGFGEHGEPMHGLFLYDATLHIPLILHNPEVFQGARDVTTMARNIDVFPTILELLNLAAPEGLQGTSLVPAVKDNTVRLNLALYCENTFPYFVYRWSGQKGIRTDEWKYIYAPEEELYNLNSDPHEGNNQAEENPEKLAEMRDRLVSLSRQLAEGEAYPDETPEAVLAHFGFKTSFGDMEGISFVNKEMKDAKIGRAMLPDLVKAMTARTVDKDVGESIRLYDRLLSLEPRNPSILKAQGNNHLNQGQYSEAAGFYKQAADLEPYDAITLYYLARAQIGCGNAAEAGDLLQQSIRINPGISFVHSDMGSLYVLMQQNDRAVKAYKRAVRLFKYDISSRYNLSTIYIKQGRIEEAKKQLDKALVYHPSYDLALKQMGRIHLLEGDFPAAEDYFKRSLMFKQNDPEVTFLLAQSIEKQGRNDEALALYKKFLEIAPSYLQKQIEWVTAHVKELSSAPGNEPG